MNIKELILTTIYNTYKLCLEHKYIKISCEDRSYNEKIMQGIMNNIPGTLSHILYKSMNAVDRIEFKAFAKLKKFTLQCCGHHKSHTKEKHLQNQKAL